MSGYTLADCPILHDDFGLPPLIGSALNQFPATTGIELVKGVAYNIFLSYHVSSTSLLASFEQYGWTKCGETDRHASTSPKMICRGGLHAIIILGADFIADNSTRQNDAQS